jgi:DNA-binding transcriptional MocR family regulator
MRSVGARLIGVRSSAEGIDIEALAGAARRNKATLLLVQSTVHNPTGSVLPEPGRMRVAELAAALGFTILDHLPGMDTLIDGAIPRLLAAHGRDVLTIGSASKAFWGGLRVGWIRAEPDVITHFTAVKSAEDLGTSIPSQVVTARLLGCVEEARAYRRRTLRDARDVMLQKLAERLPEWRTLRPAGGASAWIELPRGHSATTLAEKAARAGVDLLPGPTFSCENALDGCLRLAFSAPPGVIEAAVERLAAVWRGMDS